MGKIKRVICIMCGLILTFGVCCFCMACSNQPSAKNEVCLVVVEGGKGGGYYYKNTNCTITADVPNNKQFMKWVDGEQDVSANLEYTFTVTKDVHLTAVYSDAVVVPDLYTVNVKFGTGSGKFFGGTKHVLRIDKRYESLEFSGWQLNKTDAEGKPITEIISTERECEIVVNSDMDITAVFNNVKFDTPDNEEGNYFRIAPNGAYEFERIGGKDGGKDEFGKDTYVNSFKPGVSCLLYKTYNTEGELVESFIIARIPGTVVVGPDRYYSYIGSIDGTKKQNLKGALGNMYQDVSTAKTKIMEIMGVKPGQSYCFTVQIVAEENTPYISSDESVKSPIRTF